MSQRVQEAKVYEDGRTKQAFADSCDINKILKKAQTGLSLAHLQKYDASVYGDFENYDLLEAHMMVEKAKKIFNDLPSEVKNEFDHDPLAFAGFCSDPLNVDKLHEILPALAEPGAYFPNPVKRSEELASAAPGLVAAVPVIDPPAAGETVEQGVSAPVQDK